MWSGGALQNGIKMSHPFCDRLYCASFWIFGTIVGMFQLFYNIASTGEYSISNIAGGIYVKMISSTIGIIAYIMYRYLTR